MGCLRRGFGRLHKGDVSVVFSRVDVQTMRLLWFCSFIGVKLRGQEGVVRRAVEGGGDGGGDVLVVAGTPGSRAALLVGAGLFGEEVGEGVGDAVAGVVRVGAEGGEGGELSSWAGEEVVTT